MVIKITLEILTTKKIITNYVLFLFFYIEIIYSNLKS